MRYIYQHKKWPNFHWDSSLLNPLLIKSHQQLGVILGKMQSLGFQLQNEAILQTLTLEVLKNSEIESEFLNKDQVRSSIARKLGLNVAGLVPSDRHVDGVVAMLLDATQNFAAPLTKKRLFTWHKGLFPNEVSGMRKIIVGNWRDDKEGPMQVVSGPIGRERIHFEAPEAKIINHEMTIFLDWFNNQDNELDPFLKAGIAHLWFVILHPFDDGNGRIARTITDLQLARNDGETQRFYSMSAQIRLERKEYYAILEATQHHNIDITPWLSWFLNCLNRSFLLSEKTLSTILNQANFWKNHESASFNERQRLMLTKLFENFSGKLTTVKWAKITKCSHDTALRDINDLIKRSILTKDESGGRSTSYMLKQA